MRERLQTANRRRMKTKGMAFFDCRCMIPQTLHFFDSPFWKWGTPNICSTEGFKATETLINHTHAITITANSPPFVITTLAETQPPVSFDPPSHKAHPLLCFTLTDVIPATAWFIAPRLGHFPSSYSSAVASLFCFPAMPLKDGGAECIDRLRFYKVCALS